MPESYVLNLGGVVVSLDSDVLGGKYDVLKRTPDFRITGPIEIAINVHCDGVFPVPAKETKIFDTELSWHLSRDEFDNRLVTVSSPHPNPYMLGVFDKDFRSGDIFVSRSPDVLDAFIFPFRSPMAEVFIMNLLGTGLGMLFHASGIIYEGSGYLFCGHGGDGKSTTARLWQNCPGAFVVNDDKIIVRKQNDSYILYGTPWHGEGGMALPLSAPLKQVFILKQADHNYLKDLEPAQGVALLLARTFVPLWDDEKVAFSLKFLHDMAESLPCRELGFVPDQSAVDFVLGLTG